MNSSIENSGGSKRRILIVDDDQRNIFALKAVLRAKGFDCVVAASAEEGISLLLEQKGIEVVLMDMMMPEMDGYEALSVIRSNRAIEKVPVIAVTAQAMTGDREKCLEAGADAYVSKPINIDELISLLNQY